MILLNDLMRLYPFFCLFFICNLSCRDCLRSRFLREGREARSRLFGQQNGCFFEGFSPVWPFSYWHFSSIYCSPWSASVLSILFLAAWDPNPPLPSTPVADHWEDAALLPANSTSFHWFAHWCWWFQVFSNYFFPLWLRSDHFVHQHWNVADGQVTNADAVSSRSEIRWS